MKERSIKSVNDFIVTSCVVTVQLWQLLCCGKTFSIGDKVEWIIKKTNHLSEVTGKNIEYYYDHHNPNGDELYKINGMVSKIKAIYYKSKDILKDVNDKEGATFFAVYEKAEEVDTAYGCGDDDWYEDIDGLECYCYEVTLSNYSIQKAKKPEIAFSCNNLRDLL